jgi:hypothetical protein
MDHCIDCCASQRDILDKGISLCDPNFKLMMKGDTLMAQENISYIISEFK